MNAEFYAFNVTALLAFKMHVKVSEIQLGEFPLKGGWL